ncbi:hypothetical protein HGI48_20845 [Dickeya dianthicola]|nr:hypothetical protein HGI48_20845 [Dickeya dianthicola]
MGNNERCTTGEQIILPSKRLIYKKSKALNVMRFVMPILGIEVMTLLHLHYGYKLFAIKTPVQQTD